MAMTTSSSTRVKPFLAQDGPLLDFQAAGSASCAGDDPAQGASNYEAPKRFDKGIHDVVVHFEL